MASFQELLKKCLDLGASDVHITAGLPPMYRIDGKLNPGGTERLNKTQTEALAYSIMTEKQRKHFEQNNEIDFSFGAKNIGRFRANVFLQRGCVATSLRIIPTEIHAFDDLGLPPIIKDLMDRPNGLILVTGPTGSGKSTTLASMIDYLNENRAEHILTIEDPIEFVHHHKGCMINQREIDHDTNDFATALKSALRQDPDIVLIGELRDLETIKAALTIAETGHLTFATLHTNSAPKTISRIVDVFPANQKSTIRTQLSMVLEAIVSQSLLPKVQGGRVVATELLVPNSGIRQLIRDDKLHQLPGMMEVGSQDGMHTMNSDLARLYHENSVSLKDIMKKSPDPKGLEKLLFE
ncbi:type IV pilus twitching motility protein PilT [Chitinivibrio alkaliphilus]|uniref:Twitching motility protein n=1 Tax=Chitinivibrio alkaliphilus ACht1 TaxID=1313304 RepID=U7D6B5_9BACT|nr:type IV pilus twitching motility protein PilT [Chitinivibrio alkaliphilus]ERP32059.1 twitching motility protein [Chitinivibrio alkaliphilus ACht1]